MRIHTRSRVASALRSVLLIYTKSIKELTGHAGKMLEWLTSSARPADAQHTRAGAYSQFVETGIELTRRQMMASRTSKNHRRPRLHCSQSAPSRPRSLGRLTQIKVMLDVQHNQWSKKEMLQRLSRQKRWKRADLMMRQTVISMSPSRFLKLTHWRLLPKASS